ncbi:MAG TPA: DedA family protein [Chloroflexota bacterium]
MELWRRLAEAALRLIDRYDELAIALLIFVEEAGVPLPLPGDIVMMLAGYRVAQGQISLIPLLGALEVVTVAGASILYWLGRRGGRPLVERYGRFIHLDASRLARLEGFIRQRGATAVFLGRVIPGPRIATALLAGVFGLPYRTFLPAMAAGASIYLTFFVALGYYLGPQAIELILGPLFSLRAILTIITFVLFGALVLTLYRRVGRVEPLSQNPERERGWAETAAMAGVVATVEMAMAINLVLYALGAAGLLLPEVILLRFVQEAAIRRGGGTPDTIVLLFLLLIAGHVGYALVYARWGVRLLPGPMWLEGLLFAILPFLISVLVLLPLMGAGPLGLGLGAGLVPAVGELIRNALFGVGLGITHALIRRARNARRPLPAASP